MAPNELSELAPLAKTLNDESNELNRTIAALNQKIADLNLGIEVWEDSNGEDPQIGFAKIPVGNTYPQRHEWMLAIRRLGFDSRRWMDAESLLSASRNDRIRGLEILPTLLREMKDQAQQKITAMREGKKLANEL